MGPESKPYYGGYLGGYGYGGYGHYLGKRSADADSYYGGYLGGYRYGGYGHYLGKRSAEAKPYYGLGYGGYGYGGLYGGYVRKIDLICHLFIWSSDFVPFYDVVIYHIKFQRKVIKSKFVETCIFGKNE